MLHRRLHAVAIFLLFSLNLSFGQAGAADLTGIVSDSAGASLPAAKVVATDTLTGVSSETRAGAGGVYVFTNLRPSVYSVAAEADGFQKLVRTGVTLLTGERTRVDLNLVVGSVKETVTVAGDAPLLQTESGSITQSIDHEKMVE